MLRNAETKQKNIFVLPKSLFLCSVPIHTHVLRCIIQYTYNIYSIVCSYVLRVEYSRNPYWLTIYFPFACENISFVDICKLRTIFFFTVRRVASSCLCYKQHLLLWMCGTTLYIVFSYIIPPKHPPHIYLYMFCVRSHWMKGGRRP